MPVATATAAPPEEPPGVLPVIPRIARDAGERAVGHAFPAELGRGGLADKHRAVLAQPRGRGRVVVPRGLRIDGLRAAQRGPAARKNQVLDRHRHAVEQPLRLARQPARFRRFRFVERAIGDQIERIELRVERFDALEHGAGRFHRRERARAVAFEKSGGAQPAEFGAHLRHYRLWMEKSLELLRSVFGHPGFRGAQEEIVGHVAGGGDALVLMPTGGGKSLCYQLPALLRDGTGVVVSPLIALMQDQVAALTPARRARRFLNSTLDAQDAHAHAEARCSPASSTCSTWRPSGLRCPARLETARAVAGSRSSPSTRRIACRSGGTTSGPSICSSRVLHERFPGVPRIALTATADPQTRDEIMRRLALDGARVFISSFDRPNIRYTHRRQGRAARAAPALHPRGACRRGGHRLLPDRATRWTRPPPGSRAKA